MTDVSVVLPAYRAVDHLQRVVPEMVTELDAIASGLEIIIVVNGPRDGTDEAAQTLQESDPRVRVVRAEDAGWGRAVRSGIDLASGDILAYTNLARTTPAVLRKAVQLSLGAPGYVIKANRMVRDSVMRRAGSLMYNLEFRALFRVPVFDVNGTPKVFPSTFTELRALRRDDDLIDAELIAVCASCGYDLLEFSVPPLPRHSGRSTTNLASAWHMYRGLLDLKRELGRRGLTHQLIKPRP